LTTTELEAAAIKMEIQIHALGGTFEKMEPAFT
jgi:hypothetical protein